MEANPSLCMSGTMVRYLRNQMDIRGIEGQKGKIISLPGWENWQKSYQNPGGITNECHVRMRGEIQLRTRVYITRRRTMYKIVKSECLADKIYLMDVEAPRIARLLTSNCNCQDGRSRRENPVNHL